ncbi:hypothetical protein GGR51DRAFT_499721 [Nemania sp. FL0031]|nr:hypothetical protein GGR51DRAFT_499721 [Nemania sp. FL0031]
MAKKRRSFYGVRVGRIPGVYKGWEDCKAQVNGCKNEFRGFNTRDEAAFWVETGQTCDQSDGKKRFDEWKRAQQPAISANSVRVVKEPQVKVENFDASQSYFSQVPNFVPDDRADFDEEFGRFASSQNIQPGSRAWRQERTHAIRHEVMFHYSQAEPDNKDNIREEDNRRLSNREREVRKHTFELQVLQNMCREVGLEPLSTIKDCREDIKGVLVNIVDYIDAKRTGSPIKVWPPHEFEAFRSYTLSDGKRIDLETAKSDGFLMPLLQELRRANAEDIYQERWERLRKGREGRASRAPNNNNIINQQTEQRLEVIKEEPETPRRSLKLAPEPESVYGSESECSSPRSLKEETTVDTGPWSPDSVGSSVIFALTQSEEAAKRGRDSDEEDISQGERSPTNAHKRLRV